MKKERTFHQESKKAFTSLQFDESEKQTTLCTVYVAQGREIQHN